MNIIRNMYLEIILLQLLPHLLWSDELIHCRWGHVMYIQCLYWWARSSLVQVMVCHLFDAKPLPESIMTNAETNFSAFWIRMWKSQENAFDVSANGGHCAQTSVLTHWGQVMHICVSVINHHWFRWWLVARSVPSHYLNQCWFIINWTLGNKFQCNLNENSNFSFKKMHLKILSAKWQPFCLSLNVLSLLVLKLEESRITQSVPWLLMPWFLVSPGHPQQWY